MKKVSIIVAAVLVLCSCKEKAPDAEVSSAVDSAAVELANDVTLSADVSPSVDVTLSTDVSASADVTPAG